MVVVPKRNSTALKEFKEIPTTTTVLMQCSIEKFEIWLLLNMNLYVRARTQMNDSLKWQRLIGRQLYYKVNLFEPFSSSPIFLSTFLFALLFAFILISADMRSYVPPYHSKSRKMHRIKIINNNKKKLWFHIMRQHKLNTIHPFCILKSYILFPVWYFFSFSLFFSFCFQIDGLQTTQWKEQ